MKTIRHSPMGRRDSLRAIHIPRCQQRLSRLSDLARIRFTRFTSIASFLQICNQVFGPQTLWLFTASDFYRVVMPFSLMGLFSALSRSLLITAISTTSLLSILSLVPAVFTWIWLNAIVSSIFNRCLPVSILEDATNKPWHPLPAGRLSASKARQLLLVLVPVVFVLTSWLGAGDKTLYAMALTYMYNDPQGSDESFVARNALNALGLRC